MMNQHKSQIKKSVYQIDQSIKIENTSKPSYVCVANGKILVVSITGRDKRILKLFFREIDKPLIFKLFTFSVLCAKLIIRTKCGIVTIDKEYTSHERQIKSFILQILRMENVPEPQIDFAKVGKKSNAHKAGYKALQNKRSDIKAGSREVLKYYEKINKK